MIVKMEANNISEVVNRSKVEELYISPRQTITSKDGLHFERPDDKDNIIYGSERYVALTGKGNHVGLTGYDLYSIKDGDAVKIRIEQI